MLLFKILNSETNQWKRVNATFQAGRVLKNTNSLLSTYCSHALASTEELTKGRHVLHDATNPDYRRCKFDYLERNSKCLIGTFKEWRIRFCYQCLSSIHNGWPSESLLSGPLISQQSRPKSPEIVSTQQTQCRLTDFEVSSSTRSCHSHQHTGNLPNH